MQNLDQQQTRFNAGVDIAITISAILKNCELYARIQDFGSWYNELKILERRLYSKVVRSKRKDKILKEIEDVSKDKHNLLFIYQKKVSRGKRAPFAVTQQLYHFLSQYEVVLRKYIDVFGYGMPDKDSFADISWK